MGITYLPPTYSNGISDIFGLVREASRLLAKILNNEHLVATVDMNALAAFEENRRLSTVEGQQYGRNGSFRSIV